MATYRLSVDPSLVIRTADNALIPVTDPSYQAWLTGNTPDPYVPFEVSQRQARIALLNAGLLTQVETAVTTAGGATQITWDYAQTIRRDDPLITSIGTSLNLTSAQIDALFIQAATI